MLTRKSIMCKTFYKQLVNQWRYSYDRNISPRKQKRITIISLININNNEHKDLPIFNQKKFKLLLIIKFVVPNVRKYEEVKQQFVNILQSGMMAKDISISTVHL